MLMAVLAVIGVVISVVGFIFMRQIAVILGADEYLIDDCVLYGRILICANPLFMMQNAYQSFLVTAERPRFGLGTVSYTHLFQKSSGGFCMIPCCESWIRMER